MRRVRDCHLPEPFRTWIDRAVPLPPGVTVLPRTVSVSGHALGLLLAVIGCVGLGLPMIGFLHTEMDASGWALVGVISAALIGYLASQMYRLGRTISARRDQRDGVLRQGILIGPEGVLVRVTPNRCYPVPMDRFVRAENWSGGGENGGDYLRVVTTDGPVDIADECLTADAGDVSRAVATARGAGRGG